MLKLYIGLFSLVILEMLNVSWGAPSPPEEKEYPLRLQPELDKIDVVAYINNPKLMKLQFKCIILNGPCDIVGKFMKPRMTAGLLGECLVCTEIQKGWLDKFYGLVVSKYPDEYRAAIAKYLLKEGIVISEEEKKKIQSVFPEFEPLNKKPNNKLPQVDKDNKGLFGDESGLVQSAQNREDIPELLSDSEIGANENIGIKIEIEAATNSLMETTTEI